MNLNKKLQTEKRPVGSYTSFYRSQLEPCTINPRAADIASMKLLGISRFNPIYYFEKIKGFYDKFLKNNSEDDTLSPELAFFTHEGPFLRKSPQKR